MSDVRVTQLTPDRLTRADVNVQSRKVRTVTGEFRTQLVVDADSPTFGLDLLYVFRQNVARARKENKRVIGTASGVPQAR